MLLVSIVSSLHAYDEGTHRAIGERAAEISISWPDQHQFSLDDTLKLELGLPEGIREAFPGRTIGQSRTVKQLIGDGAFFEDFPPTRVLNHFHNPLAGSWEQAGILAIGQSSALWQQNPSQHTTDGAGGGNWSWQDARRHYLNALTRATKDKQGDEEGRDQAWADLFEALGHVMHLVQDASVPAHARNDPHPPGVRVPGTQFRIGKREDWYEEWVKKNVDLLSGLMDGNGPVTPPLSLFTATGYSQAPVPVARLIDTGKFKLGGVAALVDPALGMAEYTNGNFLSRNTLFTHFEFPRQQSLDLTPPGILVPVGAKWRRYFPKVAEGETVNLFVTEGILHKDLYDLLGTPPPAGGWFLDDRVHQSYAAKLLPRAVGYSAGLLDYFFRGKLDVAVVADPDDTTSSRFVLRGTNASTEALVDGTITLYADDTDGTRTQVNSFTPITVTPTQPVQKGDPLPRRPSSHLRTPCGTWRSTRGRSGRRRRTRSRTSRAR